jgi:hypothetical protein
LPDRAKFFKTCKKDNSLAIKVLDDGKLEMVWNLNDVLGHVRIKAGSGFITEYQGRISQNLYSGPFDINSYNMFV